MTKAPSTWAVAKMLEIASTHLAPLIQTDEPDSETGNYQSVDAQALLEALKAQGIDVKRFMEKLLLASDEAGAEAAMLKARGEEIAARRQRRENFRTMCRASALHIMRSMPELFPAGKFHSALIDARVAAGKPGIKIEVDPALLEERFRVVTVSANTKALREAVLDDGEVIEGVEPTVGDPYLVVKVT